MKPKLITASYFTIFLLFIMKLHAQSFQGIATYSSKTKMDLQMDNADIPESIKANIKASLKNISERTFQLRFDNTSSIFVEEEALAPPTEQGNNGIMIKVSNNKSILYQNIAERRITKEKDMFGKLFLVKDSLPVYNWKLENESKQIGKYTCYKASYTKEVKEHQLGATFKSDTTEEKDSIPMKTIQVVAWFTPEIPISTGPKGFSGLPGLILELNTENTTFLCSQITINPKNFKAIKEPTKGTVVSSDEYQKIMAKKMEDFKSLHNNKRGDNNTMIFTIKN